ncbi:MAG: hypothetical protein IKV52_03660 [Oscillospiraceae bacterium]|nr:hypothetical protein [Oscillospiraceae bacterium]
METGKIKKIKIFFEKGKLPQIVENALCVADCGLQGDRFAKGGEKQLTAIDTDTLQWMEQQTEKGLCFARYKANFEVEYDLSQLEKGQKLACGTALLQLSDAQKECFEECARVQGKMPCRLRTNAKYLKVVTGGTVAVNDEIIPEW